MLDADRIAAQLGDVIFRLEWFTQDGKAVHGTGFFVSTDGLALTAYHNLPETVLADPCERLFAHHKEQEVRLKWVLPDKESREWQEQHDLAVLQAEAPIPGLLVQRCVAFEVNLPRRGSLWAGHTVLMIGFAETDRATEKLVPGQVSMIQPIRDSRRDVGGVPTPWVAKALSIVPDYGGSMSGLRGMSGGPVWDTELNAIVGVVFAVKDSVYATELGHLKEHWPEASQFVQIVDAQEPRISAPTSRVRPIWWVALALLVMLAGVFWWKLPAAPKKLATSAIRLDKNDSREKLAGNTLVAEGERVRFAMTPPVSGYLYVVDQEISSSGKEQPRYLIFPTLRAGNGRNFAKAGAEVMFPGEGDDPSFVRSQVHDDPDYVGEDLTVYVLKGVLPVNLGTDPLLLKGDELPPPGLVARLFVQPKGSAPLAVEEIRIRVARGKR